MNFRFGEWYTSGSTDPQISSYEILAMPLSYLYIMMIAVDAGQLVSTSAGTELVINVVEHFIIDKELKRSSIDDKSVPNDDIKRAREELESIIEGFHKSILRCDDILTKKETKLNEKKNV